MNLPTSRCSKPRAGKQQYDAWGTLNNDSSWKWDSLLPFFKKSEIFTPPNAFQSANGAHFIPDINGFEGRVKVGFSNYFYPQAALWQTATESLGFLPSPDLSNGAPHAVGVAPESIDAANYTRFFPFLFPYQICTCNIFNERLQMFSGVRLLYAIRRSTQLLCDHKRYCHENCMGGKDKRSSRRMCC